MKENSGEKNKKEKIIPLIGGDYVNEVGAKMHSLEERGIDALKGGGKIRTLNERYTERTRFKYKNIDDYFREMISSDDLALFFQQRIQLDTIVQHLNLELEQDSPNEVKIKKLFNEMWIICRGEKYFDKM